MNSKVKQFRFDSLCSEINILTEKKKSGIITNVDKDKLVTLSHKVDVLMNGKNAYPREFYTDLFQDKLDNLIVKTDEFIKKFNKDK